MRGLLWNLCCFLPFLVIALSGASCEEDGAYEDDTSLDLEEDVTASHTHGVSPALNLIGVSNVE